MLLLLALTPGDSEVTLHSLPRQEGPSLLGTLWSEVADNSQQLGERPVGISEGPQDRPPRRQGREEAGVTGQQGGFGEDLGETFSRKSVGAGIFMQWTGESGPLRPDGGSLLG